MGRTAPDNRVQVLAASDLALGNVQAQAEAAAQTVYADVVKLLRNVGPDISAPQSTEFGTAGSGKPGDYLEYCLQYANYGSLPLSSYQLSDTLPSTLTFAGVSGTGRAAAPALAGQTLTFDLGTVPPGTQEQICFYARIGAGAAQ